MKTFNSFIFAVKTDFFKNIAFYIPYKFEEEKNWKKTEK